MVSPQGTPAHGTWECLVSLGPKGNEEICLGGGGGPAFSDGVKGSQRWIHFHFQTFGIIAQFLYWDPSKLCIA